MAKVDDFEAIVALAKNEASRGGVERAQVVPKPVETLPEDTNSEATIRAACAELADFLVAKNRRYGNSVLDPVRIMSRADPAEQILIRIDDKLSRLKRGSGEETEDVELDLLGYFLLLRIARKRGEAG